MNHINKVMMANYHSCLVDNDDNNEFCLILYRMYLCSIIESLIIVLFIELLDFQFSIQISWFWHNGVIIDNGLALMIEPKSSSPHRLDNIILEAYSPNENRLDFNLDMELDSFNVYSVRQPHKFNWNWQYFFCAGILTQIEPESLEQDIFNVTIFLVSAKFHQL